MGKEYEPKATDTRCGVAAWVWLPAEEIKLAVQEVRTKNSKTKKSLTEEGEINGI